MILSKTLAGRFLADINMRQKFAVDFLAEQARLKGFDLLEKQDAEGKLDALLEYHKGLPRLLRLGDHNKTKVSLYDIRSSAREIIAKIKIDETKIFDYLAALPRGQQICIYGEREYFNFDVGAEGMAVIHVANSHYYYYSFDFVERSALEANTVVRASRYSFLQLAVFLAYVEKEIVYIEPGKQSGTKKTDKRFNDTDQRLIVVTANWNQIRIRTEGFSVNGHLRLQPFGSGRTQHKLIWINEHMRHGYTRNAKTLNKTSNEH